LFPLFRKKKEILEEKHWKKKHYRPVLVPAVPKIKHISEKNIFFVARA
jgi:hypothetical protein